MQIIAKTKAPAAFAGAFFEGRIVTKISWPGGAGKRGYRDGRRPVARPQQGPGDRASPVLAAPGAFRIQIPAHGPPSDPPRCAAACVPAAAATAPSPDWKTEPRSAGRWPRRGGRKRHLRGAAAATSLPFADALLPRFRREPGESRLARASAGLRTSASWARV